MTRAEPGRRWVPPRLAPRACRGPEELESCARRLLRYRDGDDLVTLTADAVPTHLQEAFPLSERQWRAAVWARSVDGDAPWEQHDLDATVTFAIGNVIYRSRTGLVRDEEYGTFDMNIGLHLIRAPHLTVISSARILRVEEIGRVHDVHYEHLTGAVFEVVPTLADACGPDRGVTLPIGSSVLVWCEELDGLKLFQGQLRDPSWGLTLSLAGPEGASPMLRDIRALDAAPGRDWFWRAVEQDLRGCLGRQVRGWTLPTDEDPDGSPFSGTSTGIIDRRGAAALEVECMTVEGFATRAIPLDSLAYLTVEAIPPAVAGYRQGVIDIDALPDPDLERRQELESLRDGGDYLLLWNPSPTAFAQIHLQQVQVTNGAIRGTGGDGAEVEFPLGDILAVIDQGTSVQRLLAQKLALWSLLPDLLAPMAGRTGTLVIARGTDVVIEEDRTYLGEGTDGFRFASSAGIDEVPSENLISFEVWNAAGRSGDGS